MEHGDVKNPQKCSTHILDQVSKQLRNSHMYVIKKLETCFFSCMSFYTYEEESFYIVFTYTGGILKEKKEAL